MSDTNLFVKRLNKWVMSVPFIDPFLVMSVELPKARYVGNNIPCIAYSDLVVEVHEPAKSSVYDAATRQMKDGSYIEIEHKFIDDTGNVLETWKIKGRVSFVDPRRVSYADTNVFVTCVSFNVQSVDVVNHVEKNRS